MATNKRDVFLCCPSAVLPSEVSKVSKREMSNSNEYFSSETNEWESWSKCMQKGSCADSELFDAHCVRNMDSGHRARRSAGSGRVIGIKVKVIDSALSRCACIIVCACREP